ncbi:hypothetical protein D910_01828 [Dendroctonus ponderosae]
MNECCCEYVRSYIMLIITHMLLLVSSNEISKKCNHQAKHGTSKKLKQVVQEFHEDDYSRSNQFCEGIMTSSKFNYLGVEVSSERNFSAQARTQAIKATRVSGYLNKKPGYQKETGTTERGKMGENAQEVLERSCGQNAR